MTIGKPGKFLSGRTLRESLSQHWGGRRKRDRRGISTSAKTRRANIERRLQTQSLEARQLLAGPELVGIQPNNGQLIQGGTSIESAPLFGTRILQTAPNELLFQFDDHSAIDPATLLNPITPQDDSIRPLGLSITRAGADGAFETATAITDLGTSGNTQVSKRVEVEFRAATNLPGVVGNGTQVFIERYTPPTSVDPVIRFQPVFILAADPDAKVVRIGLNTLSPRPADVRDLTLAVNNSPSASQVIRVDQISGDAQTTILSTLPAGGLALTLDGANTARVVTDLQLGQTTSLEIAAKQSGAAGTNLRVVLTSQNFGGATAPLINISNQTINVRLNSAPGFQTTVGQLVTALNSNPTVANLVTATLRRGNPNDLIGGRLTPTPGSTGLVLPLTGASDTVVTPGFVGLGDRPNEVVFRFAEPLPQDTYQIEIYGTGDRALRNTNDEAFNGGEDFAVQFEINTPPRVLAVVPEPVRKDNTGRLISEPNVVEVYFTGDVTTSGAGSVLNAAYYDAIYTRDTVTPNDDGPNRDGRAVSPIAVELIPGRSDAVRVIFESPFARLPDPTNAGSFVPGAVRLRVGNDSLLPNQLAPQNVTPSAVVNEAGDSIFADGDQTGPYVIGGFNGIDTSRATGIRLTGGRIENTAATQGNVFQYPGGTDYPGVRDIRPDDPTRDLRAVPLGIWNQAGDQVDGIQTIYYNFPDEWRGDDLNTQTVDLDQVYTSSITEQQRQRVREVAALFSEYLGVQFIEVGQDAAAAISGPDFAGAPGPVYSIAVGSLEGANDGTIVGLQSGAGGITVATRGLDLQGDTFLGSTDLSDSPNRLLVLDGQDFDQSTDDFTGGEFFRGAFLGIGQLLGYGYADHLPQPITQSASGVLDPFRPVQDVVPATTDGLLPSNESLFPSPADIVNGQFLYRPESNDIDLYEFTLANAGTINISTIAERLGTSSQLDTMLRLYRIEDGKPIEIAANDDYFSNDSLIELSVQPGRYVVGVSASGNDKYDPIVSGTGSGGVTQGDYELALSFTPTSADSITDSSGLTLDGDSDGQAGGVFQYWFEPNDPNTTLYVDNTIGSDTGNGNIVLPYRTLNAAFQSVETRRNSTNPVKVVRVVGEGTYRIGTNQSGGNLTAGEVRTVEVPKGVNLVLDAGVRFEMSGNRIGVGSTTVGVDRSGATIQVLGTPDNPVELVGIGQSTPGTWGGIDIRGDIDFKDDSRENLENNGIFLNHIQYANIQGGGGRVSVDGVSRVVSPIELAQTRATILNNTIMRSADAAIAATPDTFLETRFDESRFQTEDGTNEFFTSDFVRVGPHVRGNTVIDNTYNGMMIRIETPAGGSLETLNVNARFDDTDIVHILNENLLIEGTPGGASAMTDRPSVANVTTLPRVNTVATRFGNVPQGQYGYRMTFVTSDGFETVASLPIGSVTLSATGSITLGNLPTVSTQAGFTGRRLYRAPVIGTNLDGTPIYGDFLRVARLNPSTTTFIDTQLAGTTRIADNLIGDNSLAFTGRLDPGLTIDPGTIIKLDDARIDVTFGARLFAEGTEQERIVFTSLNDRRFGTGGTFNTNGQFQDSTAGAQTSFNAGDWSGIYLGFGADGSFDHTVFAGGGGTSQVEGGFASFNVIEAHQSELRVANSRFENNADGRRFLNDSGNDLNNPDDPREQRVNRVNNASGTVFVRGSQPTILNNTFVDGQGPTLSFDVNSFTWQEVTDPGRSTGPIDNLTVRGNSGPLIQGNEIAGGLAGVEVRGGAVATEVVWDDTDIVHIVRDQITVPNQHIYGGLRLESDARGSLVVKFDTLGDVPEQTLFVTTANGAVAPGGLPVPGDVGFIFIDSLDAPGTVEFIDPVDVDFDVVIGDDFIELTITEAVAGTFATGVFNGFQLSPAFDLGAFDNFSLDRFGTTLSGFSSDLLTLINGSLFINVAGLDYQPGDTIRINTDIIFPEVEIPFQPDALLRRSAGIVVGGNSYTAENEFVGIADRIGGSLQVIGQPDFPVVLTSLADDAVGAGFTPDGRANVDTNSNGIRTSRSAANANLAGEWEGIVIREAASDSNASITSENEPSNVGNSDTNSIASRSQFLGEIAPDRKSGDENRRLGLIVDGEVSSPSDVDVYSFVAEAGTQVWLDIDRTDMSLDTVIELVNSNGQTIVLSDDAFREAAAIEELLSIDAANTDPAVIARRTELLQLINSRTGRGAQAIDSGAIFGLATGQLDAGAGLVPFQDQYSTNSRDAGMRVILPGVQGVRTVYHVRVRSAITPASKASLTSDNKNRMIVGDTSNVIDNEETLRNMTGGLRLGATQGSYQLQIRIEESDVFAGTQIRYSDVLYARNGVQVVGGPLQSPLSGEAYENNTDRDGDATTSNNTLAGAQRLGLYDTQFVNGATLPANLTINPDGSLTVARNGVDVALDNPAGPLGSDRLATNISGFIDGTDDVDWYEFEINYSQLTRDGAAMYLATVFDLDYTDGLGRADLALHVFNAAGELVLIGGDSNIADDLSLPGTGGASDLSRGSFGSADPFIGSAELPEGTYFVAVSNQGQVPVVLDQFNNRNATNPLIRLEPIDSTRRIAEEGFTNLGIPTSYTQVAQGPITPVLFDQNSIIDYSLDDVFLYVNSGSNLFLVNPFTGTQYVNLGDFDGQEVRDVAFTANGELFAYTQYDGQAADDSWSYVRLNTVTGAIDQVISDGAGISTFNDQNFEAPPAQQILDQASDVGLSVEAMTIRSRLGIETGFFVGNRPGGASAAGLEYNTNILYAFDEQTGLATGPNFNLTLANAGAGTDVREIGQIDTTAPQDANGNPTNVANVLGLSDATELGLNGQAVPRIFDGDTFTLFDGTSTVTFEFNQGFTLISTDPASILNGTLVRVTPPGAPPVTFELTNSAPSSASNIVVPIDRTGDATSFAQTLATIIQGRGIAVSSEGTQLAMPTATLVELISPTLTPVTGLTLSGGGAVTPGNSEVKLFPTDTADVIAQRIVQAVAQENNAGRLANVNATARGRSVLFTALVQQVTSQGTALRAGGQPNGGLITGLEIVGTSLFAISNTGGLYRVDASSIAALGSNNNVGIYVDTATDLLGIQFTGLRAGPNSVEGGRFANLLFATATNGRLYAFNTAGELQNIFAGGQSSVPTGIFNAQGLDFATLDYNLWHVTGARGGDAGHGINEAFHGARPQQSDGIGTSGNNSLVFNYTTGAFNGNYAFGEAPVRGFNNGLPTNPRLDGQGVQSTYNFPGGARGTVQSNEFSLAGYSPADMPTMYFNYFLNTDGVDDDSAFTNPDNDLFQEDRDTLRVYVIDANGVEHLVATNNEARGPANQLGVDDEFDDPTTGIYADNIDVDVQQLYDNTGTWRQARVPLGVFAGQAGLALRIEFSTAGTTITNTGEIRAVAAAELTENDTFVIGGETFSIDLAPAIVFPSGRSLADLYANPNELASFRVDGQDYYLNDGTRTALAEATLNNPISIDLPSPLATLTSGDIANAVADAFDRDLALSRVVPSGTEIDLFYQDNPVPVGTDPQFFYNQNPELLSSVYLNGIEYVFIDEDTDRQGLTLPFNTQLQAPRVPVDLILGYAFLNPDEDPLEDISTLTIDDVAEILALFSGELDFNEPETTIEYGQLVPSGDVLDTLYADPTALFVVTIDGVEYALLDNNRNATGSQVPVALGSDLTNADIGGALQDAVEANTNVAIPEFRRISQFNFSDRSDPVDPFGNPNASGNTNRNDLVFQATPLPYTGGSLVIEGRGTIGTFGAVSVTDRGDVDLLSVRVAAGTEIVVSVNADQPGVDNAVRFFDSDGAELVSPTGGPLAVTNDARGTITLTAPQDGLYFIGVSGPENATYDPRIEGTTDAAQVGGYALTIAIESPLNIQATQSLVEFIGVETLDVPTNSILDRRGIAAPAGVPVTVGRNATATEVAIAVQQAVANRFYEGDISLVPRAGSALRLPGLINANDPLGPFVSTSERFGDQFGGDFRGGAADNATEGAYIDDIIIGFAERGELVTGSDPIDPNAAFVDFGDTALTSPDETRRLTDTGSYQLEIRDASEYVASGAVLLNNSLNLDARFRTFDTNDRLTDEGVSLTARSASEIVDGSTFILAGQNQRLTFEFDIENGDGTSNGIVSNANRIAVRLPAEATAEQVADLLIARINAPDVRPILGIIATRSNLTRVNTPIDVPDRNLILIGADSFRTSGTGATAFESTSDGGLRGDSNRDRDEQGVIMIESSRIIYSENSGVQIVRNAAGNVISQDVGDATPNILAYPRNFAELNTENFLPGVVVRNNTFAFNQEVGIDIVGLENGGSATNNPVGFDRLINNTLIGGTVTQTQSLGSQVFGATFFPMGSVSFADSVVVESVSFGDDAETSFRDLEAALGSPDCHGIAATDPDNGLFTLSLGSGGSATFVFNDNLLTGSSSNPSSLIGVGDGIADLIIFESGIPERVRVEVSRDNVTFFQVGEIFGLDNTIDLDAFGFGLNDRFSYVRLTDLSPAGSFNFGPGGADIDAIGALSTILRDAFTPGQIGIRVEDNAAPTLLNNVISNFETGIAIPPVPPIGSGLVDFSSVQTVIGSTTFYRNLQPSLINGVNGFGVRADFLDDQDQVFVDPVNLVFTPQSRTPIIDSGRTSIEERGSLSDLRQSLGLLDSPILAPRLDQNGQTRLDDPTFDSRFGSGGTAFVDRGAEERADQTGPRFVLVSPRAQDLIFDNDQDGFGRSITVGAIAEPFEIQLIDGIRPADPGTGVGINDSTVTSENLVLTRIIGSGVGAKIEVLQEGRDYRFAYEPADNLIRLTPIAGIWTTDSVYTIEFLGGQSPSVDGYTAVLQGRPGTSYGDGQKNFVDDQILETELGIQLTVLRDALTQTDLLTGQQVSVLNGQTITIFDGVNPEVTFEFVTDLTTVIDANEQLPFSGNYAVQLPSTATPQLITRLLAREINRIAALGVLDIEAIHFDEPAAGQPGRMQLLGASTSPSDAFVSFEPDSIFRQVNQELDVQLLVETTLGPNGERLTNYDGQQITVFDGNEEILFEFDSDGVTTVFGPDINGVILNILPESSPRELVQALLAGIQANNLDVAAFGASGVFRIRGNNGPISVTSPTGAVLVTGNSAIGVAPGFGLQIPVIDGELSPAVQDGQSFTIGRGLGTPVTFELDFDSIPLNLDARLISLPGGGFGNTTPDQLADAIAQAVNLVFPSLAAANAGNGRVTLGNEDDIQLNTAGTILTQIGSPGDGPSTPVVIRYNDDANVVAAAFADAAIAAGIDATLIDDRVLLRTATTPQGDAVVTNFIADKAGNRLQPGSDRVGSRVEILVGDLFDYGDAFDPYNTTLQDGGPRHQIVDDLYLGTGVTADVNGVNDDADNDDGVIQLGTLRPGFGTQFQVDINRIAGTNNHVSASQPFYFDAWFDWNGDGSFGANEVTRFGSFGSGLRVVSDSSINTIVIDVPSTASLGDVQGRFRLSYEANLGPDGMASAGEVEDYQYTITNNPFQSSRQNEDVNDSGAVTPLDALLIINMLNANGGSIDLTNIPVGLVLPPFPDVDGNGTINAIDALRVINYLNTTTSPGVDPTNPAGEPMAAGEPLDTSESIVASVYQSVGNGVMASPSTIIFDPTRNVASASERSVIVPEPVMAVPASKTSVFDSPVSMQIDAIVDSLVQDRQDAQSAESDEGTSAIDEIFASMG
ncbi:pre-peptidase C-terminal domain-containing protein [Neorhodopirellula pilleata]|uniref:Dockerin type I repeat protein n=1 Tax=Neorhodopirellula pilleata TaxID=2714738 RepID=A0A5C6AVM0_9BACT|nr:pre-peptidase C-terminal domain-containing protein [Neorhodopirellula pilleata]TWU03249.1 hypothetical protein Pla100_01670 [Neorhodopirellula pilleata]